MNVVIKPSALRDRVERVLIAVDFVMLFLVVVNLLWLIFDTLFASQTFRSLLSLLSENAVIWYRDTVHNDFAFYDFIFISIFLTEFCIRWIVAVYRNTYHRWFFYPFIHWYDLLGCIPVGSFRWLRLLRIFSIIYRLHKLGVIDWSDTFIVRFIQKYMAILVEEVSDRVVINVLSGVQAEVRQGNPLVQKIAQEAVLPRKQIFVEWLSERLAEATKVSYEPYKMQLKEYVDDTIATAVRRTDSIGRFQKVPLLGDAAIDALQEAIAEVVYAVMDQILEEIGQNRLPLLTEEVTDVVTEIMFAPADKLSTAVQDILIDSIELVKEQVSVQQWKEKERAEADTAP